MKIAYVATHPAYRVDGVTRKIGYQTSAWRRLGHEVEIFFLTDQGEAGEPPFSAHVYDRENGHSDAYRRFVADLKDFQPDAIYLRWQYHRSAVTNLSKDFPIFVELNGDILKTARLVGRRNIRRRLIYYHTLLTYGLLFRHIAGFVPVTREIGELPYIRKWNKPVHVAPNAIRLQEFEIGLPTSQGSLPRLAFIGLVAPWHGVDKIVALAKATQGQIEIDLIGAEEDTLPDCPSNLKCHGFLKPEDYLPILANCDVGLDALSLHTKDMEEGSHLKVREYVACGLPLILASRDTGFDGQELPPWVLQIANAPDNVDRFAQEIVKFAKRMKGRRVSHEESAPFFEIDVVEERKLAFFKECLSTT